MYAWVNYMLNSDAQCDCDKLDPFSVNCEICCRNNKECSMLCCRYQNPLTSFAVLDCFPLLCFMVHTKAVDVDDIHSTTVSQGFTNSQVVFWVNIYLPHNNDRCQTGYDLLWFYFAQDFSQVEKSI